MNAELHFTVTQLVHKQNCMTMSINHLIFGHYKFVLHITIVNKRQTWFMFCTKVRIIATVYTLFQGSLLAPFYWPSPSKLVHADFLVGLPFLVKPPFAVWLVADGFLFLVATAIPALVLVVKGTSLSTGWLDKMY